MLRICRTCAREYEGDPTSTLCPDCVAEQRKTTIRDRTCRACGATFPGGPRAWYCPSCRAERRREQSRRHKQNGAARLLGSTDLCRICGAEYVVSGGNQKYCPDCAPEAVRAIDRAQGRAWNAANVDLAARIAERHRLAAQKTCIVCGRLFTPTDASITCSKACSIARQQDRAKAYEQAHKTERNAQRRQNNAARLNAMTDAEREAHRQEYNRKCRENYRKRKEKNNG